MPIDQIDERKEKDPDDIDEMPVKAEQIDWSVVILEGIHEPGAQCEECDQNHTDRDVERVHTGHQPIDIKEQLGVVWIGRFDVEVAARQETLGNFPRVFETLNDKKERAQNSGD